MKIVICLLLGYLLGSLNPAALLAKLKKVNLRESGTKNLGASNTLLVMGKGYGAIVMVLDILKAFLSAKIANILLPELAIAGLVAGLGAVIGHVFPFYMHFQGGKGLASFGGMVMAFDPLMFLTLLILGLILMLVVNYSFVMPMTAAALFPIFVALKTKSISATLIAGIASVFVIVKHWSNIGKAKRGEETKIRDVVKTKIFAKPTK